MDYFTIEEINLMCIYNTQTRDGLLKEIVQMREEIYDVELLEIIDSVIKKLNTMTDDEYILIAPFIIQANDIEP